MSSVLSLAWSASFRVSILTKACRFSLLTMQVCTVPNRTKIFRKSASVQLRGPSSADCQESEGQTGDSRHPSHEKGAAQDLDVACRQRRVKFDPALNLG